jgi:hypothetical protein
MNEDMVANKPLVKEKKLYIKKIENNHCQY